MITAACAALAAAVLCAPGPLAARRLARLWPQPPSARWWRPWAAGPVVLSGLAGLLVAGPGGALAGALAASVARRRWRLRRSACAAAVTAGQLADALRRVTDELRAGSHPTTALAGARTDGPLARALLEPAAIAAQMGDDVPTVLRRAAADRPELGADVERVAAAWSLAERHGIPLTELIDSAHADIRWRLRFGHTVRAQLAGPRATASVLTALPILGLGLGQLVGADPVAVLRGGVLGQVLLVVGVALVAAGSAWVEHILRAAVPR